MDENLVGYLLNALDPEAQREVEEYVRDHPEAQKRLELLRQVLQPLAADSDGMTPPPGLRVRTLAHIATQQCRNLPAAPRPTRSQIGTSGRRAWRRADMLVAAAVLISAGLFFPAAIFQVRYEQMRRGCQHNLRAFGEALSTYSDIRNPGAIPNIADLGGPHAVAGALVPVLHHAGVLARDANIRCPAVGPRTPSSHTLDQVRTLTEQEVDQHASNWMGDYAYTLGHWDKGRVLVPVWSSGRVPVMADGPPVNCEQKGGRNSSNHRNKGQNVLHADGHVQFIRNCSIANDDIYVNQDGKVAPGVHAGDTVLGGSKARIKLP